MAVVTPTESVLNRCAIEDFDGVFVLTRCFFFDICIGVGAFVLHVGLTRISSLFSSLHRILGVVVQQNKMFIVLLFSHRLLVII